MPLEAMSCCSCHVLLPGLAGFLCVSPIKSVVFVLRKGLLKKKIILSFQGNVQSKRNSVKEQRFSLGKKKTENQTKAKTRLFSPKMRSILCEMQLHSEIINT